MVSSLQGDTFYPIMNNKVLLGSEASKRFYLSIEQFVKDDPQKIAAEDVDGLDETVARGIVKPEQLVAIGRHACGVLEGSNLQMTVSTFILRNGLGRRDSIGGAQVTCGVHTAYSDPGLGFDLETALYSFTDGSIYREVDENAYDFNATTGRRELAIRALWATMTGPLVAHRPYAADWLCWPSAEQTIDELGKQLGELASGTSSAVRHPSSGLN